MKHILSFFLILCSSNLFAADTVRIYQPKNMVVTGTTNTSFTLGSDNAAGESTDEASAAKVYVPIEIGTNVDFTTLPVTDLFNTGSGSQTITYPLLVSTDANDRYLYALVKFSAASPASFYSAAVFSALIPASSANTQVNFSLTPNDICKVTGNTCNAITTATAPVKVIVYFYLSSVAGQDITGSQAIDVATATGGVYFETQLSAKVYDAGTLIPVMTNLSVGDKRLVITYGSTSQMDPALFKRVIAYGYTDTSTIKSGGKAFQRADTGALINKDIDISKAQSGELTIADLSNNTTYNVALAFQDKFLFASALSESRIGKPIAIQELLKKQACYLLTAGFGEEHYVITFFRHYRDQVLANSWLGRKFINIYYKTAPRYALMIYKSETIRFMIRMAAYTLYFFFNFYWLVLIFMTTCYYLDKLRKNKVILQNNRL